MEIIRIDSYDDPRFPKHILYMHGAFLVDNIPTYFEIRSDDTAVLYNAPADSGELIDTFRFYAPHITRFINPHGRIICTFTEKTILTLPLTAIQPSQFYVDQRKLDAIAQFIRNPSDNIIQVMRHGERYISLDGHTRLFYAVQNGWDTVRAVEETADSYIFSFVEETIKRHIHEPKDMLLLDHSAYEIRWNHFCDTFFANMGE